MLVLQFLQNVCSACKHLVMNSSHWVQPQQQSSSRYCWDGSWTQTTQKSACCPEVGFKLLQQETAKCNVNDRLSLLIRIFKRIRKYLHGSVQNQCSLTWRDMNIMWIQFMNKMAKFLLNVRFHSNICALWKVTTWVCVFYLIKNSVVAFQCYIPFKRNSNKLKH